MTENEKITYSNAEFAKRVAQRYGLGHYIAICALGLTGGFLGAKIAAWQTPQTPVTQTLGAINTHFDVLETKIAILENAPKQDAKTNQQTQLQDLSRFDQGLLKHEQWLRDLTVKLVQNFVGDCVNARITEQMTDEEKDSTIQDCAQRVTQMMQGGTTSPKPAQPDTKNR